MSKGFTLLEIVGVLIIMGIIAGVVLSRIDFSPKGRVSLDEIKNHIRYAQLSSMNSDFVCGISFNVGSYFYFCDLNKDKVVEGGEKMLLPGMDTEDVSSDIVTQTLTLAFDSWGRPYSDVGLSTEFSGNIDFSSGSIYVTRETGFIP